jgi:SAM-dependent methyltransferase
MFDQLTSFVSRPQPFSVYTAPELWTHPHVSQQMLLAHLDPGSDLASRRSSSIESTVEWVDSLLGLKGKKVCDLGCGPGLYATRFHDKGALVTGLDISKRSVSHATSEATKSGRSINFLEADYTNNELPDGMDLYALIYCDFCALSPAQRASLLTRIRSGLADGGHLVMDVCTLQAFETFKESDLVEHRRRRAHRPMHDVWSCCASDLVFGNVFLVVVPAEPLRRLHECH